MSESDYGPEPSTTDDNRRTADRTPCLLEVAISHATKGFLGAKVLDISSTGVKLLVDPPPAPGDHLRLTFLAVDGRLFQLPATAVHYVEHGKSFVVGCRFSRDLDERELEALL
jgi:hypothetical protein